MSKYFEPIDDGFEIDEKLDDIKVDETKESLQEQGEEQRPRPITTTYHIDVVKEIRREIWERFRGYTKIETIDPTTGMIVEKWKKTKKAILSKEGAEQVFNILTLFGAENFIFARLTPRTIDNLAKTCTLQVARKLYEERERMFELDALKPQNLEIVAMGCGAIVLSVLSRALYGREHDLWYGVGVKPTDREVI